MLVTYTPEQQVLFDTCLFHWTEETDGWWRHDRGTRIHVQEHLGRLPARHNIIVHGPDRALLAKIDMPDTRSTLHGMPRLLRRLAATFSTQHRRDMDQLVDAVALLLLEAGCSGLHALYPSVQKTFYKRLTAFDACNTEVPMVFSDAIAQQAARVAGTPTRASMDTRVLVAHNIPRILIPLPSSQHGLLELRERLHHDLVLT